MGVIAPANAQNKQNRKPRKKLKELLMMADSLRLQLRQSADRGRMLQWGDSLLMAELGKSKMSEKKKQRFMKHYAYTTANCSEEIHCWQPIITR